MGKKVWQPFDARNFGFGYDVTVRPFFARISFGASTTKKKKQCEWHSKAKKRLRVSLRLRRVTHEKLPPFPIIFHTFLMNLLQITDNHQFIF